MSQLSVRAMHCFVFYALLGRLGKVVMVGGWVEVALVEGEKVVALVVVRAVGVVLVVVCVLRVVLLSAFAHSRVFDLCLLS
jgi:hypothetical protein